MHTGSILDPVRDSLPPQVWDDPRSPEPQLKPRHNHWIHKQIYTVLEDGGYEAPHEWLSLFVTGSLTTFQWSEDSDMDISLFVNSSALPEWSRAEMIGLMLKHIDGTMLPGTPFPMQCYVVARQLKPTDLYQRGLRSGYDMETHHWVVPPERERSHDTEAQENGFYVWAMEQADRMERLTRYEPDKAVQMWHHIHERRQRDHALGKGDASESNILYKWLSKRGLFHKLEELTGEHIAALNPWPGDVRNWRFNVGTYPTEYIRDWMQSHYPDAPMQALKGAGGWQGEPEHSTALYVHETPANEAQRIIEHFGYAHPHEDSFYVAPNDNHEQGFLHDNPYHQPVPEQGQWVFNEAQPSLFQEPALGDGGVAWQRRPLASRRARDSGSEVFGLRHWPVAEPVVPVLQRSQVLASPRGESVPLPASRASFEPSGSQPTFAHDGDDSIVLMANMAKSSW